MILQLSAIQAGRGGGGGGGKFEHEWGFPNIGVPVGYPCEGSLFYKKGLQRGTPMFGLPQVSAAKQGSMDLLVGLPIGFVFRFRA